MVILYTLLLVLLILVAVCIMSLTTATASGGVDDEIQLDETYKHYLVVRELENIVDNYSKPYELHNILERYLLTSYPNLTSPKASKYMIKQLKEKQLPVEIHDKVLEIVKTEPVLIGKRSITTKTIGTNVHIMYGKLKFITPKYRFDILSKQGTLAEITKCALEVSSLMPSSQQWSIPLSEYRKFVEEGATVEGFASPFNSQIMRIDPNLSFCSISPSDALFGSLGNFFDQDFADKTVIVNPPFIESLLKKAATKCVEQLEKGPCKFIFYGPNWTDSKFYEILEGSKYKVSKQILRKYKHNYEDLMKGKNIKATFNSVVFVLTFPKKKSAD